MWPSLVAAILMLHFCLRSFAIGMRVNPYPPNYRTTLSGPYRQQSEPLRRLQLRPQLLPVSNPQQTRQFGYGRPPSMMPNLQLPNQVSLQRPTIVPSLRPGYSRPASMPVRPTPTVRPIQTLKPQRQQQTTMANDNLFGRSRLHPSRIPRFQKYFQTLPNTEDQRSDGDNGYLGSRQRLTETSLDGQERFAGDGKRRNPQNLEAEIEKCDGSPNIDIDGVPYVITAMKETCPLMTWTEASKFCESNGMATVSLGSSVDRNTAETIMNVTATLGIGGLWIGGYVTHPDDPQTVPNVVVWTSSFQAEVIIPGEGHFSHTGDAGEAQPDNFEFRSSGDADPELKEHCVAVLNDRFDDGQKLHDLACYYELPTICREIQQLFDVSDIIPGPLQ